VQYTLDDFDYSLPDDLIAQRPAEPRDHSRLLIYDRDKKEIWDDHFFNLPQYLPGHTTLVVNNSKVEKCRLLFDGGKIEIFVLDNRGDKAVEALVRPGRKFKLNKKIDLEKGIEVTVSKIRNDGTRILKLNYPPDHPVFDPFRYTPFPPYMKQDESLADRYQTSYAKPEGSKAAPTAGLHFTGDLIKNLKSQGIGWEEVTLHVGMGTFAPVNAESIDQHVMHTEWYQLDESTAKRLRQSSHITCVGTTSVRVLETIASKLNGIRAESGETDIFIKPGYEFKITDALVTNFHLPKSTLLMLVAAFMGFEEMKRVYRHAIKEGYRFYSFGDAMLIL